MLFHPEKVSLKLFPILLKVLLAYCGWEYDLVNVERHDEMKSVEVVIKAMIIGQNLQPSALPSLSVQELRSSFWVIRQMPG